jgi:hypothetical protein
LGRDGKNFPMEDTKVLGFRKKYSKNDGMLAEKKNRSSQKYFFLNPAKGT